MILDSLLVGYRPHHTRQDHGVVYCTAGPCKNILPVNARDEITAVVIARETANWGTGPAGEPYCPRVDEWHVATGGVA